MDKKNTRIMALDIGMKRTGVAMTDELLITAQPVTTFEHRTLKQLLAGIKYLTVDSKIGRILIGYPRELDGRIGPKARQMERLSGKIRSFLERELPGERIEIVLWDERLTTRQAEKVVIGSKLKNKAKSAALDRVSAAIMLEAYLESIRNSEFGMRNSELPPRQP